MAKAKDFFEWLKQDGAVGYAQLLQHAQVSKWPKTDSLIQAWSLIDQSTSLKAAEKTDLKRDASLAFVEYERSKSGKWTLLGLNGFGFGVFFFVAAIVAILAMAMFEAPWFGVENYTDQTIRPLLTRLADVEAARGLITFVFTVGVIALALIIVTANVTANDGDAVRFERSKEILTSLIAIMGTILGFYFGKADSAPATPERPGIIEEAPTDETGDAGDAEQRATSQADANADADADLEGAERATQ